MSTPNSLSVIIPARNEEFLPNTINDVLANMRGDTEIICVLDGYWPDPPLQDHPKVHLIHHTVSVGQRAAVNEAARLSQAKYILKLDAHCAVDEGFDVKLMADMQDDWTVIPRMFNWHIFDRKCKACGAEFYQGPIQIPCPTCSERGTLGKVMVWQKRPRHRTDFAMFDNTMHFQYWREYERRPEAKHEIADVMSSVGACFFMRRERFLELGGVDENHGSWGNFGTEISCKSWLSGGRQVVNKKTWFGHAFRTQGGDWSFPYPISHQQQEKAREYSRWLWLGNNWPLAKRPLKYIIDKFKPVPSWE